MFISSGIKFCATQAKQLDLLVRRADMDLNKDRVIEGLVQFRRCATFPVALNVSNYIGTYYYNALGLWLND
jgi:hypothetical protein